MAKTKKIAPEPEAEGEKKETIIDRFQAFIVRRSILTVLSIGIDEENKKLIVYLRGFKDVTIPEVFEDHVVETRPIGSARPA